MNAAPSAETALAAVASAIGEPARARMLLALMDGHARTSTELAAVAEVSAPTASAHLSRLRQAQLLQLLVQGKHRYYSIASADVGRALEGLLVAAGGSAHPFTPSTPPRLRAARTCYDHLAGTVAVQLHDRLLELAWVERPRAGALAPSREPPQAASDYTLTARGEKALRSLGIDVDAARRHRRRFAYGCVDWSERRPHLAGAIGAALLELALKRKWLVQDFDSRILSVTAAGRRALAQHFGLRLELAQAL
jgi:DNA-binding transcriptional ArsR family regulator